MNTQCLVILLLMLCPITLLADKDDAQRVFNAEGIDKVHVNGNVRIEPKTCLYCPKDTPLKLSKDPTVKRNGRFVRIADFLSDYREAFLVTIFLDPTDRVVQINYHL